MSREHGAARPLDDDALAVLGVLSRGYRKMSVDDVAHAHVFNRVSTDRVAYALSELEQAGFVQRHVPPALQPREPARFGLTPLGRSAALGRLRSPDPS
jgi:DNA-binding HxlR family transcriptional regulator